MAVRRWRGCPLKCGRWVSLSDGRGVWPYEATGCRVATGAASSTPPVPQTPRPLSIPSTRRSDGEPLWVSSPARGNMGFKGLSAAAPWGGAGRKAKAGVRMNPQRQAQGVYSRSSIGLGAEGQHRLRQTVGLAAVGLEGSPPAIPPEDTGNSGQVGAESALNAPRRGYCHSQSSSSSQGTPYDGGPLPPALRSRRAAAAEQANRSSHMVADD